MKIVGIGLNKTGTKTLGACLQHWRLKHASFSSEAFELWRNNDLTALMSWVENYQSFEDWPWPLIFKEIDRKFPGSKFILTRRKDPHGWFESLCRHAELTGPTVFRKYVYGYEMPHGHKDAHIRCYEEHLQSVRKYFLSRADALLEVCWEEGSGWPELAQFLKLPVPTRPFPRANKASG